MSVNIGQEAPGFELYDTEKHKVSLSDFRGQNVLLLFFPLAFTRVCTKELCSFRDSLAFYNDANTRVIGISVDSLYTLAKFKEAQQYNFTLLSDFNKEVSAAYGSLYDNWILDMKGVSKRSAFIIDKKSIIRYAEVLENSSEEPNYDAIRQTLKTLA